MPDVPDQTQAISQLSDAVHPAEEKLRVCQQDVRSLSTLAAQPPKLELPQRRGLGGWQGRTRRLAEARVQPALLLCSPPASKPLLTDAESAGVAAAALF